jgi:sec-independent protein translocase protein TatC
LALRRGKSRPEGGTMPLVDHLRELRRRLVFAAIAIVVGTVVGWIIYPAVFDFVKEPYVDGVKPLLERKGFDATLVLSGGVGSAFTFRLKLSLVIGLVISSCSATSCCRRASRCSSASPPSPSRCC